MSQDVAIEIIKKLSIELKFLEDKLAHYEELATKYTGTGYDGKGSVPTAFDILNADLKIEREERMVEKWSQEVVNDE